VDVYEFLKKPTAEIYRTASHTTLDCETTNINYGDSTNDANRLLLTCSYNSDGSECSSVYGGLGKLDSLIAELEQQNHFVVGQNIKFDLRWLAKHGLDLSKVLVWDTMIAEHVFYGNRHPSVKLDLGSICKRYGLGGKDPYVDLSIKAGVCPSELPTSYVLRRCNKDIYQTEMLFRKQLERAIKEGKLGVILTRCIATPMLADIETNGLQLDKEEVDKEYFRAVSEQAIITKELAKVADINWNSPMQVADIVYGETYKFKELLNRQKEPIRTPSGRAKADVGTIRKLTASTKKQRALQGLLDRRSIIEAQLTKTLTKFKLCVDNGDLLYAQFNQAVTVTHRLSSSGTEYGVQFQNMPRIFKPCVTSRHKGWDVWEADGAQLEFRVAAFLGNDSQAIYDIENGVDIHQFTADAITKAGQTIDRQTAKASTFKPLFAGRSGTKAEQAYYAAFKAKYHELTATQEGWKATAIRTKKMRMPSGLEFFFPNIKAPRGKDGWIPEESNIFNYQIQSFATADIIPIAITYQWHGMKRAELESFIVNTVHDSAISEVNPKETEELNEIILAAFGKQCYNYLKEVYNVEFNVPLGCGIKIGKNWGRGEETVYTLPTPY
jgi:DNA polymerase-1